MHVGESRTPTSCCVHHKLPLHFGQEGHQFVLGEQLFLLMLLLWQRSLPPACLLWRVPFLILIPQETTTIEHLKKQSTMKHWSPRQIPNVLILVWWACSAKATGKYWTHVDATCKWLLEYRTKLAVWQIYKGRTFDSPTKSIVTHVHVSMYMYTYMWMYVSGYPHLIVTCKLSPLCLFTSGDPIIICTRMAQTECLYWSLTLSGQQTSTSILWIVLAGTVLW